jgi:hypothetical protein
MREEKIPISLGVPKVLTEKFSQLWQRSVTEELGRKCKTQKTLQAKLHSYLSHPKTLKTTLKPL